ncbi:hydroxyisourate hydrolase [Methylobacterium sp. W2]|uniref:hydroxyisourate hydrolase n=1 Tax=Methylobacterium sp. W2 TaxID=2598107 RepID=UPI001D0CAAC2|nr:hydroxyisourate hydrolase [Methylobacterium sp. W2]MCC0807308.1 hydroxyisourate hydrolase [Methylobacterium sp. W2]
MNHPPERPVLTRRSLVGAGLAGIGLGGTVAATGTVLAQGAPAPSSAPAQPGALTTGPTMQSGLGPRLTMHAIDNFHGTPGAGMVCDLSVLDGDAYRPLKTITTGANGRSPEPLLIDDALKTGRYELLMHFEEYFARIGVALPNPNFLGLVPIHFHIRDASQRYHLPILFTPWGYSYYRGS